MKSDEESIEERVHTWNSENEYEGNIAEQREKKLFLIKPTKREFNKAIKRAKRGDSIYIAQ